MSKSLQIEIKENMQDETPMALLYFDYNVGTVSALLELKKIINWFTKNISEKNNREDVLQTISHLAEELNLTSTERYYERPNDSYGWYTTSKSFISKNAGLADDVETIAYKDKQYTCTEWVRYDSYEEYAKICRECHINEICICNKNTITKTNFNFTDTHFFGEIASMIETLSNGELFYSKGDMKSIFQFI